MIVDILTTDSKAELSEKLNKWNIEDIKKLFTVWIDQLALTPLTPGRKELGEQFKANMLDITKDEPDQKVKELYIRSLTALWPEK
jgi:hypothetical protein